MHGDANASCWTSEESALVKAADALFLAGKLSDGEVSDLRSYFSDDQIIEIIQICGFYRTISYLVGTFELPLEKFGARFGAQGQVSSVAS